MTTSDMVRRLCRESHVSLSELARRVGQSPQNFSKKLQRETLTLEELNLIAEALGVGFEQSFVFSSGRVITTGAAKSVSGLPGASGGIMAIHADHPLRKALTGDYDTVVYVDGPTGHCTFYALPDDVRNCFGKVLDRNPGVGIVASLLIDNYVSPEDKQEVSNFLEMHYLRGALARTPIVSKIFRYVNEKGERYSELRVVRIGEADKVQGVVITIADRDEMIREKVERNTFNSKLLGVTASLASTCSFVISVNMKDDSAWICRTSRFIRELYGNIEMTEVPFKGVVLPVILRDVHPDDAERVESALSADVVRTRLAESHDYSEGFRYKYGDRYYFADMRVSRYGDGSDSDCFVAAFLNRDAEIRAAQKHRDELMAARVSAENANKANGEAALETCRRMRSALAEQKGGAAEKELLGMIEELEKLYKE